MDFNKVDEIKIYIQRSIDLRTDINEYKLKYDKMYKALDSEEKLEMTEYLENKLKNLEPYWMFAPMAGIEGYDVLATDYEI